MQDPEFRKSKIDLFSTRFTNRFKFFKHGFGDTEFLKKIPDLIRKDSFETIPDLEWKKSRTIGGVLWKYGVFKSPFSSYLPESVQTAHIQMISPKNLEKDTPICIHFAMTGDQGFYMRLFSMALPLVKDGIASVILEIPYYGLRKPKSQFNIFVNTVSDFFKMCGGTISEGISLLEYFKKEGYTNLGVSGVSMGGNISCFVTSLYKDQIASVPCLPPHSPQPVFVRGILQDSLHWKKLSQQANSLEAAREKMDALMDSVSLLHFPIPISKKNAIIVAGDADAIVPPQSVQHLHNHWQGSELRWVSGGHVRSIFGKTGIFRQAIRDSFARSMENKRL
jgi:hypothetical protein